MNNNLVYGFRCEIYFDGEKQEVGFMQGLDDFSSDEDAISSLLEKFDKYLPIPDLFTTRRKNTKGLHLLSFFTEEGYHFFKNEIIALIDYWENNLLCEVKLMACEFPLENVLYQDPYQFVVASTYKDLVHVD